MIVTVNRTFQTFHEDLITSFHTNRQVCGLALGSAYSTEIRAYCYNVDKPHTLNKKHIPLTAKKQWILMSMQVTHVAGWTSKVLSRRLEFPPQTIMFVQRSAVEHQICMINFCTWAYTMTGLTNLYRHWQFWFLVQIPHTVHIQTVHITFYLFMYHHIAVEKTLLTEMLLSLVKMDIWTTNINDSMSKAMHKWRVSCTTITSPSPTCNCDHVPSSQSTQAELFSRQSKSHSCLRNTNYNYPLLQELLYIRNVFTGTDRSPKMQTTFKVIGPLNFNTIYTCTLHSHVSKLLH